jgi:hypothetical protein
MNNYSSDMDVMCKLDQPTFAFASVFNMFVIHSFCFLFLTFIFLRFHSDFRGAAATAPAVAAAAEGNRLRLYSFSSANEKISDKTKHIMKISHINVNIYDKAVTSQQK